MEERPCYILDSRAVLNCSFSLPSCVRNDDLHRLVGGLADGSKPFAVPSSGSKPSASDMPGIVNGRPQLPAHLAAAMAPRLFIQHVDIGGLVVRATVQGYIPGKQARYLRAWYVFLRRGPFARSSCILRCMVTAGFHQKTGLSQCAGPTIGGLHTCFTGLRWRQKREGVPIHLMLAWRLPIAVDFHTIAVHPTEQCLHVTREGLATVGLYDCAVVPHSISVIETQSLKGPSDSISGIA